jgi:hypothetical protein
MAIGVERESVRFIADVEPEGLVKLSRLHQIGHFERKMVDRMDRQTVTPCHHALPHCSPVFRIGWHYSATIGLRNSPTPSISTSQTWPAFHPHLRFARDPDTARRAHHQHVARGQSHETRQQRNRVGHVENQIAGVRALHDLAIEAAFDFQARRALGQFIGRHQPRAECAGIVEFLPAVHCGVRNW